MIRWMEEILHHPGWLKPAPINRINHRSIGAGFLPHVWRKKTQDAQVISQVTSFP